MTNRSTAVAMMGRTHALAGVATLWLLQVVPEWRTPDALGLLVVCAALGALLPDLDATQSLIKRIAIAGVLPFAPLSWFLNRTFGHRGALHSLLGWAIASLLFVALCWLLLGWMGSGAAPLALSLGYASHLTTDACTKSGIPLLYPRRKRYHLLPRLLRLTTGSAAEEVVFTVLAVVVLALLLHALVAATASLVG